jgi:hypothetical protein
MLFEDEFGQPPNSRGIIPANDPFVKSYLLTFPKFFDLLLEAQTPAFGG